MKSKDQILLEQAYQKIFEDFTRASDPNMLKPEEVASNEQETQSREEQVFNPNNIIAAFKQQGKTEVTPMDQVKDKEKYLNVLNSDYRAGRSSGGTGFWKPTRPGEKPDLSKLFLVQKQLGLGNKALRAIQTGNSVKVSKGVLEFKDDNTANFWMFNDVDGKLAFNKREINDAKTLYSTIDQFNKFAR